MCTKAATGAVVL